MSCESALNFDQPKTFSENYELMRVWSWLDYKFTESYCRLQLFSEFIQTQKRYPTSLDKISILAKLLENLFLAKNLTSVAAHLTRKDIFGKSVESLMNKVKVKNIANRKQYLVSLKEKNNFLMEQ